MDAPARRATATASRRGRGPAVCGSAHERRRRCAGAPSSSTYSMRGTGSTQHASAPAWHAQRGAGTRLARRAATIRPDRANAQVGVSREDGQEQKGERHGRSRGEERGDKKRDWDDLGRRHDPRAAGARATLAIVPVLHRRSRRRRGRCSCCGCRGAFPRRHRGHVALGAGGASVFDAVCQQATNDGAGAAAERDNHPQLGPVVHGLHVVVVLVEGSEPRRQPKPRKHRGTRSRQEGEIRRCVPHVGQHRTHGRPAITHAVLRADSAVARLGAGAGAAAVGLAAAAIGGVARVVQLGDPADGLAEESQASQGHEESRRPPP